MFCAMEILQKLLQGIKKDWYSYTTLKTTSTKPNIYSDEKHQNMLVKKCFKHNNDLFW